MASSSGSAHFSVLQALSYESIPSIGLSPPLLTLLYDLEVAVIDLLLEEAVAEVEIELAVVGGGHGDGDHPFWLAPPVLSPCSSSGDSVASPAVDDVVPGLVLARSLVAFSVAPVTPPVVPLPAVVEPPPRALRRGRRWASCVLFPHGDAVAAVRAVQRDDVVWHNGDVRLLPLPAPPSPPPRRSLRLLRRRLLE